MELRQYWRIVWDRRLLVLGVTLVALVAAIVSVATLPQPLPSYQATVQLAVRPTTLPVLTRDTYVEYYAFLSSEFLNDEFINLVESPGFLQTLQERYPGSGSIKGKKAHRLVTFTVSSDRGEDAMNLARGIPVLLTDPVYRDALTEQNPKITVIDPPRLTVQPGVRRGALDVGVRTLLGFIFGLALAFLLHYLDDTLHDRGEAERLTGLPVLGEIPA
jgi:capsular polysaccharide biosynthesis protein